MRIITVLSMLILLSPLAAAQPEEYGPYTFGEWEPPDPPQPTTVYYPENANAPGPIVAVVHGFGRGRPYHVEMGRTLASRGLVAVVPTLPCHITCNFDSNADTVNQLMDLAEAASADQNTPLYGKANGAIRGVVGHSWGSSVFLASSRDASILAAVGLDPVDQDGTIAAVMSQLTAATMHLYSDGGGCGGGGPWEANVFPGANPPYLGVTVTGSYHCDPEDPGDNLCPNVCGTPDYDNQKAKIFRRYTVAWLSCILLEDPSMATWLGGASFQADMTASLLHGEQMAGLDQLPCSGPQPDGGPQPDAGQDAGIPDAGQDAGSDAGADPGSDPGWDAGADPGGDAGSDSGSDPGADPGSDPGSDPGATDQGPGADDQEPGDSSGCSCSSTHSRSRPALVLFFLLGVLIRGRSGR